MRRIVFVVLTGVLALSGFATDPAKLIICWGEYGGYGQYLIPAAKAVFPGSQITSFPDTNITGFISALKNQGPWDMAVWAGLNYRSLSTSDYQAFADYYNSKKGPAFFNDWGMHYPVEDPLHTAMGVSCTSRYTMPPRPHYGWVTTHPICSGITNWTFGNPGVGTAGHPLTTTTATAVTGWTTTPTTGQAGICYCTDKHSVISGYKVHCILDSPTKLWTNILNYMWDGYTGVEPSSLGKVKAMYR